MKLKTSVANSLLSIFVLYVGISTANAGCGPENWIDTGKAGPLGWTWHFNKSATTGTDNDAKNICMNFFYMTGNCNTDRKHPIPGIYGSFLYKSCKYNSAEYTLNAENITSKSTIQTVCQVC